MSKNANDFIKEVERALPPIRGYAFNQVDREPRFYRFLWRLLQLLVVLLVLLLCFILGMLVVVMAGGHVDLLKGWKS